MKNINISASIPIEFYEKLKIIAQKEDRSLNYIIKKCLEKGLKCYENETTK